MEFTVNAGVGNSTSNTVAFLQEASNRVFHEDVNAFVNTAFLQRTDDLEPGCIADVGESREGVAAKVSLVDEVLWRAVKHGAPLFELPNTVGGFLGVEFGHAPVRKPLAALHRVVEVNLPPVSGVGVLEGCCATTFGHDRVGFAQQRFGDDGGLGAAAGCFDSSTESGTASSDDDDIVFVFGCVFAHHLTSHNKEHHIAQATFGHGEHPQVAKEDENQRRPKPEPVGAVQHADFAKENAANSADAGGPTVEHATGQVAQGVAGGDVHREQEGFNAHDEGANRHTVAVVGGGVEVHRVGDVPPLDDQNDHGGVEEIAVKVVEDEQALLAFVANGLVDVGLVNPACGWAGEEGAVVDAAHVVAGATETERYPKHEDGGVDPFRVVPLVEAEEAPFQDVGRENGRHDRATVQSIGDVGVVEEEAPEGVEERGGQPDAHGHRLTPPVVDSVGAPEPVQDREFDAFTHSHSPCSLREHAHPVAQGL